MSGDRGTRTRSGTQSGTRSLDSADRAQTVLDFVVGMSVFLVAVGFTFAFVPSLLEPYAVGEGATVIVAERGAARLVESSLAASGSTATLSHACTFAFFNGTDAATAANESDCAWTANAGDLHAELGVDDFRGLNLTVTQDGTVRPLDLDGPEGPNSSVSMHAGPAPPRTESVSAASRIVTIDDPESPGNLETYRLTLRVW